MALCNQIPIEKWLTPIISVGIKYILLHPVTNTHIFIKDHKKKSFDENKKKYNDVYPQPDTDDDDHSETYIENDDNDSEVSENSFMPSNISKNIYKLDDYRKILNKLTWNSIVFPQKHLLLTVPDGQYGNSDLGNGPGGLGFKAEDFTWEITTEDGISVRELVEGTYRLKGSKYTLWYELLTDVKIIEYTPDKLHLEIHFDYGS
jgi:hypothetical protein